MSGANSAYLRPKHEGEKPLPSIGTMNFGKIGRTTQDEATALVAAALDAGINQIDTADMYSGG